MKRVILPLLLWILLGIFFEVSAVAEGGRDITVLYTGSVWGNVDPCVV